MSLRTSLLAVPADSIDECDALIIEFTTGGGAPAVMKNLRIKLEVIGERVAELLDDSTDSRYANRLTEIDVVGYRLREQIKELANEHRRYFGTLAGLLHNGGDCDDIHPSTMVLSQRCIEVVFMALLLKNVLVTAADETVYRSCLGILITS